MKKKRIKSIFVWKKNSAEKLGFRHTTLLQGRYARLVYPFQMLLTTPLLFAVDSVNMRVGVIFRECVRCFKDGCHQNADARAIFTTAS